MRVKFSKVTVSKLTFSNFNTGTVTLMNILLDVRIVEFCILQVSRIMKSQFTYNFGILIYPYCRIDAKGKT